MNSEEKIKSFCAMVPGDRRSRVTEYHIVQAQPRNTQRYKHLKRCAKVDAETNSIA